MVYYRIVRLKLLLVEILFFHRIVRKAFSGPTQKRL